MTNSWYVVIENIPRPSSCRALSGTMARMLPFVSAGDHSYWPATFPSAATLTEQVGKFITHISWLGNLDSFKAAHCPCSPLSLSLLSRGRLTGSSEKECRDAENRFQEQCKRLRLRPTVPETLSTDTFGDWWEAYTQDFFGESADDIVARVFGNRPQKTVTLPFQRESTRYLAKSHLILCVYPFGYKVNLIFSS